MTIGYKFDMAKLDQLHPGISTTEDATKLFGPAASESTMANGAKLLQWQYSQGTIIGGNAAHLAILFSEDGIMQKVTHKTLIR